MSANYAFLDWLVFASYGAILLLSGWWFNRKRANSSQDFFLGGNSMPTWMVAISVLATSQSAATFIGGPDQGYQGHGNHEDDGLGVRQEGEEPSYHQSERVEGERGHGIGHRRQERISIT